MGQKGLPDQEFLNLYWDIWPGYELISQMCIVTGPRIELAITLINRMKNIFTEKNLMWFDTKENPGGGQRMSNK